MVSVEKVLKIVEMQQRWRRYECLNMVASENVMSPLAEQLYLTDFMGRYNEHNAESHYQGTKYAMEIEEVVKEIFRKRFDTEHIEVRPLSGGMANLIVYRSFLKVGDSFVSPKLTAGGHVSSTRYGVAGVLGLTEVPMYFDNEEMTVDVDKTVELINNVRPKLVMFGRSVIIFPEPIKEIRNEIDPKIKIVYDAAHVFGLVWGGEFQDPLNEGADIITTSTHKTFPGPQGGAIIARKDLDEKNWKKIQTTTFPGIVYNHHIHRFPALAIAALEMNEFGREYAKQVVKNAKVLAEELASYGFKVLGESKGFTHSHQVLVDVRDLGGGRKIAFKLEDNNIIVTKVAFPWDSDKDATGNPSGIRIGVQELTRWGMKEDEMREIAKFYHEIINESKNIREKVVEFRANYRDIKYSFEVEKYEDYLARLRGGS
ncbi:MAG: serine hydroxymethyltransferase [Candidatus Njordarchaeia archaeon]